MAKKYPAYKGKGVAIWINKTDKGKKYLTVQLFGQINIPCFPYEPPKEKEQEVLEA